VYVVANALAWANVAVATQVIVAAVALVFAAVIGAVGKNPLLGVPREDFATSLKIDPNIPQVGAVQLAAYAQKLNAQKLKK
jgi:hypothetical protein